MLSVGVAQAPIVHPAVAAEDSADAPLSKVPILAFGLSEPVLDKAGLGTAPSFALGISRYLSLDGWVDEL